MELIDGVVGGGANGAVYRSDAAGMEVRRVAARRLCTLEEHHLPFVTQPTAVGVRPPDGREQLELTCFSTTTLLTGKRDCMYPSRTHSNTFDVASAYEGPEFYKCAVDPELGLLGICCGAKSSRKFIADELASSLRFCVGMFRKHQEPEPLGTFCTMAGAQGQNIWPVLSCAPTGCNCWLFIQLDDLLS